MGIRAGTMDASGLNAMTAIAAAMLWFFVTGMKAMAR